MQSWEWGLFQERLGRKVERYLVLDGESPVAAFTLIHHSLPFGLRYGYAARGPVVAAADGNKTREILDAIKAWARADAPYFIFLRLEPPIGNFPAELDPRDFTVPSYYVQPRYNLAVPLAGTEEEILLSFHSSTRSNVARAERRGVTAESRDGITPAEYRQFREMAADTIRRNSGVNAYPDDPYFAALLGVLAEQNGGGPAGLSIRAFYGYHEGEPAATQFVLFFGSTATYLYGASYTKHLSSKAVTYLHVAAMLEAKRRGMEYYDLGGIDAARWPKLTDFKRQFKGHEFEYAGNIDIPLRPFAYRAYNFLRRLKK